METGLIYNHFLNNAKSKHYELIEILIPVFEARKIVQVFALSTNSVF